MQDAEREQWRASLRDHAQQVEKLSRSLADPSLHDKYATFLTAQVTRHRISMALLTSRLGEPSTVS
ncbi:MAG TPA: hypothetical protein VLT89_02560 [Usitatibacter sp.]|nr:hypothetical protein [Usitatibacter sp.]